MPIFRVKSVKIYTGPKKFTRIYPWDPWQIRGMHTVHKPDQIWFLDSFFYYSFSFHEYICGIQYVFIFVPQQRCSSSLVILILGVVAFIDLTGKKCASPITEFLLKRWVFTLSSTFSHPMWYYCFIRDVEPLPQTQC